MTRALCRDYLFDKAPRSLEGVTISVFEPGTTTKISETIYAGRTGATTLANPFTTDDIGEFEFWLDVEKEVDLKFEISGLPDTTATYKVLREGGQGTTVTTSDEIDWTGVHTHDAAVHFGAPENWIDISHPDYGAVLDGVADDQAAVEAAIAAAPVALTGWGAETSNQEVSRATVIYVPPNAIVRMAGASPVSIPEDKNIVFYTPAKAGARIVWEGTGDYAFTTPHHGVGRMLMFKNLVFHKGGLDIDAAQRQFYAEDCQFYHTTGPAINIDDRVAGGSVSGWVVGCDFWFCAGGVHHKASTYAGFTIERCTFMKMTDVSVLLDSTGYVVAYCLFEGMEETAATTKPHVQLLGTNDTVGHILLFKLRFGAEVGTFSGATVYDVPREAILLGGVGVVDASDAGTDVSIEACEFFGRNGGPTASHAAHAMKFNKRPRRWYVGGRNHFRQYNGALIQEDWWSAGTSIEDNSVWGVNAIQTVHEGDIFSQGGVGWGPQPIQGRKALEEPRRFAQNLITNSNNLSATGAGGWAKVSASVAQDAEGPDGEANTAWTVSRTATGQASVRQTLVTTSTGEPLVLSLWAKAGTEDLMRIGLQDTTNGNVYLNDNGKPIILSSRWERYFIVCPKVPASATLVFWIFTGTASDSASTGDFAVYGAQVEEGYFPTAYQENAAAVTTEHAALPLNGLILGKNRILYGTAPPASGRHEAGDILINTAPTAGGPSYWHCTTSGSPGTWGRGGHIQLSESTTWNPPAIADGAVASVTVAVAGATTQDVVGVSFNGLGANDVLLWGHVQADGTVRVVLLNKTGANLDLPSGTLRVNVRKLA